MIVIWGALTADASPCIESCFLSYSALCKTDAVGNHRLTAVGFMFSGFIPPW